MNMMINKGCAKGNQTSLSHAFKSKIMEEGLLIVKASGKTLNPRIMGEIASIRLRGRNVVLVHGGGVQIDERVRSHLKCEPQFDSETGLRLTDEKTMRIVAEVLNRINLETVSTLSGMGISARGFSLDNGPFFGNAIGGRIGRYGRITHIESSGVMESVLEGKLAVIAPLGKDAHGALNLNADDAAVAIAASLGVKEIVMLTSVDGIYVGGRKVEKICGFCSSSLAFLMENPAVGKGMKEKIYACALAAEQGISVRIASGMVENAIEFALNGNAHGTTVSPPRAL